MQSAHAFSVRRDVQTLTLTARLPAITALSAYSVPWARPKQSTVLLEERRTMTRIHEQCAELRLARQSKRAWK